MALAAAVALVLVAIVVRNALDGDGTGDDGSVTRTLACPPDLVTACEAAIGEDVQVVEQTPSETATALIEGAGAPAGEADLWLAPRPWAEAVSELAESRALDHLTAYLDSHQEALARSPVVVVAWQDRAEALAEGACGGELTWLCVGEAADREWAGAGGEAGWGRVRAGLADPSSTAGLVVLGTAAAAYLDDSDYHTNDIGSDLLRWLRRFDLGESSVGSDPVSDLRTRGPGHLAVLGTVEASAREATEWEGIQVQTLAPLSTVDLVLVPLTGVATDAAESLAENGDLLDAVAAAGWRVPGRDLAPGLDPDLELPDGPGIPAGVVLHALFAQIGQ